MSYSGVYGSDETCPHGDYWRSCGLCWRVGPQASDEEINASLRHREKERTALQQAEVRRRAAYDGLSPKEKIAAQALWDHLLEQYPGLGSLELWRAVRNEPDIDSWVVGSARSVCAQAKTVVEALERVSA